MSFNSNVKERAMVACARRCCLCHKYCAVNMECAHIKQKTDGGSNDYDNCIPLCFDCHAATGHYNNHHPKGIKFTEDELKKHRDRWYRQVDTGAIVLPTNYGEIDRRLFDKIYELLGGSSRMQHFKNHDYGATYDKVFDDRLNEFFHVSENPETEFLTLEMESAFADLKAAIKNYLEASVGKVFRTGNQTNSVPAEWLDKDETMVKRYWVSVELMNEKAAQVWKHYCRFVAEARRILKAETPEIIIKTL